MYLKTIKVGLASCGIAAGASKVFDYLESNLPKEKTKLMKTGCIGMCFKEPLVEINDETGTFIYGSVDVKKAERIVKEHILQGNPIKEWIVYSSTFETEESKYLKKQHRILLKNSGKIDPENINSYLEAGGYKGLEKAVAMTPADVILEIEKAGLRGRGGAGFPTHIKWKLTREAHGTPKYIICNADEGDPGAFMDRSVLESDPHSVLEGMAIAAYAIGAEKGYVYIRAEYPLAIKRLRIAIEQARKKGFLGKGIFNGNFTFDVEIREGAGAFVCGEETALMASIEGHRGMPRFKPPFPAQKGLWGKPTCINNVETLAAAARILSEGADVFSSCGTEKSKGTKIFALAGKVKRGGLIEVPMGTTIREIVFDIGGGISTQKAFKAVQTGGPSGGCIPASMADITVDYEALKSAGAIMGSGGLIVMDEDTCMVDVARFFLKFTTSESCGKCTFCRIGTYQMLKILDRICSGQGEPGDLERLQDLGEKIIKGSLCGLGQTAPNPVLTTLKYFREEYEAHVYEKRCPAGKCIELIEYRISAEKCIGCGLCAKKCPANAVEGEKNHPYRINIKKCIKCGICSETCRFDAVETVSKGMPAGLNGGEGSSWRQ
ncbi:MAG TPA: NADH-quinone oxidoreductase subunit F [Peptococcaceae bacterium]|nr:MAG: NADH dehydrogenase (Quinone) [Clostridia bacterium 41_269]HBT20445.1 NADH-quinone oxidoreductase subunit F [Peptococcaceae bacterium]